MPQIFMMLHAADVNRRRIEIRSKSDPDDSPTFGIEEQMNRGGGLPYFNGKPIDQLNSEEYLEYLKG
jgi:hypothetical protein